MTVCLTDYRNGSAVLIDNENVRVRENKEEASYEAIDGCSTLL